MKILLIRHGKTYGNHLCRYVGTTDEPLTKEGRKAQELLPKFKVDYCVTSPLVRAIETARIRILTPVFEVESNLRECDFGDFENKNYKELSDNEKYQDWIDSNGKMPFPNGEKVEDFKSRCLSCFCKIVKSKFKNDIKSIAFVVHNGTIMSIMAGIFNDEKYFDYSVGNGYGYELDFDGKEIKLEAKL